MKLSKAVVLLVVSFFWNSLAIPAGFVEDANGDNVGLLVSVSHGLPGLDKDIENVQAILENKSYNVSHSVMLDSKVEEVKTRLKEASGSVSSGGSLFFYFTGHGNKGVLVMQDRNITVAELREAVESGRSGLDPLARLVLVFDSCYSGTLVDPFNHLMAKGEKSEDLSQAFVDSVVNEFTKSRRVKGDTPYWSKLFVFASTNKNETCLASSQGSKFTLGLQKAFEEAATNGHTVKQFVANTQKYTDGSHPTYRVVPAEIDEEVLVGAR